MKPRSAERPKITGGVARGRMLAESVGPDVRPTSSRVREALFSMIGHDLSEIRILDAYGGTGLLGLEAWSRGAEVTIVESNPTSARTIEANAAALGAPVRIRTGRVEELAPGLGRFDGVIADPPYRFDPVPIVAALTAVSDGWLVLETDERVEAPDAPAGWAIDRRRTYGGTALVVYRADREPE